MAFKMFQESVSTKKHISETFKTQKQTKNNNFDIVDYSYMTLILKKLFF